MFNIQTHSDPNVASSFWWEFTNYFFKTKVKCQLDYKVLNCTCLRLKKVKVSEWVKSKDYSRPSLKNQCNFSKLFGSIF